MPEDLQISHPQPLGRLERVDLRTAWPREAQDFTPWLARDENISVLAETLGMELEVEAQEKDVGPFRADILCRGRNTDSDADSPDQESWVLIENQLEKTDHQHLGQLMMYAAGLHTATIVWIAQLFQDEHRAALDWLNEITDKHFRFFGLEVELWKIGESLAAPKFNIVSKPNDWTQEAGARQIEIGQMSALRQQQLKFWQDFSTLIEQRGNPVKIGKPKPQLYINSFLGKTGFRFSAGRKGKGTEGYIYVELYLSQDDAKPHFHLLKQQQSSIEEALNLNLDWRELPRNQASRILAILTDTDPTDKNDWPRQQAWLADTLVKFDKVFRPIVHELDATDWQPDDEPEEDDPDEIGQEP